MAKEFALENFLFFEEVEIYRTLVDEDRKKRALQIVKVFLEDGCDYEINIDSKTKKEVMEKLNEAPVKLFDRVNIDVVANGLIPSFSRFLSSDLYKEMQRPKRFSTFMMNY